MFIGFYYASLEFRNCWWPSPFPRLDAVRLYGFIERRHAGIPSLAAEHGGRNGFSLPIPAVFVALASKRTPVRVY